MLLAHQFLFFLHQSKSSTKERFVDESLIIKKKKEKGKTPFFKENKL